jgi:hypothetical protein
MASKNKQKQQQSEAPQSQIYKVMANCRVSVIGSKDHFAGLDTLPENFDLLSAEAQAPLVEKASKVGAKRKADMQEKMDQLSKKGQRLQVVVSINGTPVTGSLTWNKEETGLTALCNFATEAKCSIGSATSSKRKQSLLGLLSS